MGQILQQTNRRTSALLLLAGLAATPPALACDLALALAVDVSGSVDPGEFQIQMQGLADGLRDGAVSEALVKSRAALMLVQWTGSSRQIVSVPWTQVRSFEEVEALADRIADSDRAWRNYSTAIGEALTFTLDAFASAPDCERRVIDLSGDGLSNEGVAPLAVLPLLQATGVTVNAIAIEGSEDDLTGYFWENVITGPGAFVVTADGFDAYAAKMRLKLRRETTEQVSLLGRQIRRVGEVPVFIEDWPR